MIGAIRYERCPPEPVRFHEYANLFPMLEGEPAEQFKEDVRQNGVREPIVMYGAAILDGRNRYMAARDLGIRYPVTDYIGDDPLGYVISLNLKRRHLSESQRAMVAAKLAKLPHGGDRTSEQAANLPLAIPTQEAAATMLNVSERSVRTARVVEEQGAPELVAAVEKGEVSVSAAAVVAVLPQSEQAEIVARGEKEILAKAKEINAAKATVRRTERIERIAEQAKGNVPLGTTKRYPVIYADPPWRYENPPIGSTSRAIENHYDTMTLEAICAMPVSEIATDDAILYMWATAPKLAECMKVIEAWGFVYRTNAVWDKELFGMGYHFRNQHELLLVAKRGELPPPEAGTQPGSIYRERRAEHSAKPEYYRELIAGFYPTLPRIELFARDAPEGWDVWGNQSGASDAA